MVAYQNQNPASTLAAANEIMGSVMLPLRASPIPVLMLAIVLVSAMAALTPLAHAQYVGREQDIVGLRLGQRVLVDDGTCPAGEVKEVSGAKMTTTGVLAARKCVPRLGPKKMR